MQKLEVISQISQKTGIRRTDVQLMLELLLQLIQDTTAAGEKVHFRRFGVFGPQKKRRSIARNIAKNTAIIIPEHYVPHFVPSKAFVTKVREALPVY